MTTLGGCAQCRKWLEAVDGGELVDTDVSSSFERPGSYFSALTRECPRCGTVWFESYWEEFAGHDLEDEFGDRYVHRRRPKPAHLEKIAAAAGTRSLDATTFGNR